jgi:hypothetical protein
LLIQPGQKPRKDDLAKRSRLTSPSMASRKSGWASLHLHFLVFSCVRLALYAAINSTKV